jgi:hypothetical protein
MPYLVTPDRGNRRVLLTCSGDMTLVEMKTAWWGIHHLLAEFGWKRILVDATAMTSEADIGEPFDLAKLFCHNFPQSGRIALIVRWDQSKSAKLLETLVRSVGVYLTVFVSEKPAKAWIADYSSDNLQKTVTRTAPQVCVTN